MPSLLGPHILVPTPAAKLWIDAGCLIVKCVNDFGAAHEVGPNVTVIGREMSNYPDDPGREITGENMRHLDPIQAARFFVGVQKPKYDLNPLIKLWEGVNEPQWDWNNRPQAILDMQWYAAFEAERCRLLHEMGLRAVIGNWSVGIPDIGELKTDLWEAFLPALRAAKQYNGVLGVHEYSDQPFSVGVDERGEDWDVFRIIKVHRLVLEPNGLGDLPVVLTEFGINFRERPEINYSWELQWADKMFRKYPWIKGLCVFTFGTGREDWRPFDVNGTSVAGEVAEYIRREAAVIDNPAPSKSIFVEGIDVSHWQSTIDWLRVSTSSIKFAYIRVSDGLSLDSQFDRNWINAKSNNIARGAYQYFRASKSGKAQAELLLSKTGSKMQAGDLIPVLDVETLDGVPSSKMLFEVSQWIETIRAATGLSKVILYGRKNQFDLWNMKVFRLVADLWVAAWDNFNFAPPTGWTDWKFHQYAVSAKESVPGISTTIDRDRFHGTLSQFTDYVNSIVPIPVQPPVSTRFVTGDRVRTMQALNVRQEPGGPLVGFQPSGSLGTIIGGPEVKDLGGVKVIWWKVDYDNLPDGWSSGGVARNERYLEKFTATDPPVNLIPNGDYTEGFHTPFMDNREKPPRVRDNVRVPLHRWFKFKDDVIEPRLDRQDPFSPWLAPEGVLRSADVISYPFTELLPPNEFTLYLNSKSPVVMHYFKLYGIMWWEQGATVLLPPGTYEYGIEAYEDIYIGNHEFITNEAIAAEWRLNISGQPELDWSDGNTLPLGEGNRKLFGHWRNLVRRFTHLGGNCDLSFERRSRWGVRNTGTLLRKERLFAV